MKKILLFITLITLLTLSTFASALIKLEPSGNAYSDTEAFIDAFNNVKQYESIIIKEGEYFINNSLPELTKTVNITSDGIARIHLDNVTQFITLAAQDSSITNLFITGDGNRLSDAILIKKTSHAKLDNLHFSGLNVALKFQYAHDFRELTSLNFYNNELDFLVERLDQKLYESSSFHFTNCVMLHSEAAIRVDTVAVNFSFTDCVIAPWSHHTLQPVKFHKPIFQAYFKGNRFEAKGFNSPVDNLYINANDFTFPSQAIELENNYFTGVNISKHINLGKYTNSIYIEKNFFKATPIACDILLRSNSQTKNSVLVKLNRALSLCQI
jgi:hypothetical protein